MDGRLILSVWLSSKHSMLMSLPIQDVLHCDCLKISVIHNRVHYTFLTCVSRKKKQCWKQCTPFWLSSLTHKWIRSVWEWNDSLSNLHNFFGGSSHLGKSVANVIWITDDFKCVDRDLIENQVINRPGVTTEERVRVVPCRMYVWVCHAYAQWKLPLKLTNLFLNEW